MKNETTFDAAANAAGAWSLTLRGAALDESMAGYCARLVPIVKGGYYPSQAAAAEAHAVDVQAARVLADEWLIAEHAAAIAAAAEWAVNLEGVARRRSIDGYRARLIPIMKDGYRDDDRRPAEAWLIAEHAAAMAAEAPAATIEADAPATERTTAAANRSGVAEIGPFRPGENLEHVATYTTARRAPNLCGVVCSCGASSYGESPRAAAERDHVQHAAGAGSYRPADAEGAAAIIAARLARGGTAATPELVRL
jgi:hypothetical protein